MRQRTPDEWRAFRAKHARVRARSRKATCTPALTPDRDPRIWGYGRASTRKQEASPETQKEAIRNYIAYAQKAGHIPDGLGEATFLIDTAVSGKVSWSEREAGRELFRQIQPGDHIVIPKLDRAFRRLADCVVVLERFERTGVRLHICNLMGGAIDLSSPMGRFLIHVLAAFAELERAFISERTKDGLARRKKSRQRHSRFPGYGFRWKTVPIDGKPTKVRERDDEERGVMRSILQWRLQDTPLSWREISDHLCRNLKLATKDGGRWDQNRVRRAFRAELKLQYQENQNTLFPTENPNEGDPQS